MVTEPGVSFRGVPIIAAFLTALVIILFALAVLALRASPRAWANRSLACGALAGGVWIMGVCGLQTGTDLRFWLAVAFAGASFIPAALLQLVRHYPVTTPSPSPAVVLAALVLAAAFAVCAAAPSLLFARPRLVAGALVRDPGPLYPLFVAYFLLGWVLAIVAFARKWSLATAKQRTQLRYFGTGVILSAAGGITTNLLVPYFTGNSSYYWLGPCFVVPFVVFAAHSIVRHHLMDLRLVLHERVLPPWPPPSRSPHSWPSWPWWRPVPTGSARSTEAPSPCSCWPVFRFPSPETSADGFSIGTSIARRPTIGRPCGTPVPF
jgi:hypothetical protein